MATEIKTIAVIGAGDDGREFACAALRAGYRTVLEDVSDSRLEQAIAWIANVDAHVSSRLVLARTVEAAVREADLIIEAVTEETEMKIEMFTIFDKFAKPEAVFASCSRSVPIAELASVTFCPERCIGMRLGSVAGHADALELVRTPQTSEQTIARCREVCRRMGKEVALVAESVVLPEISQGA
ncbi:MAG: 3-hydroxyacyl-CoA dehydrogenase NAD-binding [Candidatus Acidoferrum typicum]|nr:3-hydroxyacyl-CoA dehydrogenase NAD-binding [Candidatus Acidoferrum typicum]